MNKKSNKKIIIYIIFLIIFVSIVIGALALGKKIKENPKNEIDSKIEKSQSDKNYKIVSKYNANIKKNQDIKLRIENIIRGEEAEKALNNYNKKASYQVNIEKKDEEELLLVEYEIDFIDFDMSDIGANKDVSAKICQDENKEYIEYNNNIYSPLVEFINNDEFTKEKKTKGKFVTTIPKGCTDYKIKIGEKGEHEAYFDGI